MSPSRPTVPLPGCGVYAVSHRQLERLSFNATSPILVWRGWHTSLPFPHIHLGEGNGTPLQYSCLENPMDGGARWAVVHGVAKSRIRLSSFIFHFHALEKEMATHSSVLAWRIPGTGEPGGLPSLGSHRVRNDLAAAAAHPPISLATHMQHKQRFYSGDRSLVWWFTI